MSSDINTEKEALRRYKKPPVPKSTKPCTYDEKGRKWYRLKEDFFSQVHSARGVWGFCKWGRGTAPVEGEIIVCRLNSEAPDMPLLGEFKVDISQVFGYDTHGSFYLYIQEGEN